MSTEAPKPLRSLYGASDRLKHDNTVKSMACPGDRPQEIFTPKYMNESIVHVFGRIALDPCAHRNSTVPAESRIYGKQIQKVDKKGNPVWKKGKAPEWVEDPDNPGEGEWTDGTPALIWVPEIDGQGGLDVEWPECTYSNPPFVNLRPWMAHASKFQEVMQLVPVRTHRKWWCKVAATCDAIAYLKPVVFDGYNQAFPAPLAMLYWGSNERFLEAFEPHSCHVGGGL